ncbi:MAG: ROK family protein [Terriglobia bacterium]
MTYSLGVDLGGTFTKAALVASDGQVLAFEKFATAAQRSPESVFTELRTRLRAIAPSWPPPGGCGIGVPGTVDYRSGWLGFSGPLGWHDVNLAAVASGALGCEAFVDIDVNAGALADLYFGCAKQSSEMLYISWGTGIGAGFVVGRRLYHSRGGAMGNFGHMPADPTSSRLCYCGARGCLEIEAGGKAMADKVRERLAAGESSILRGGDITPERLSWAANRGDTLSLEILGRSAVLMARALAGVLAFLNPDTVVFAGGVSPCLSIIREPFEGELFERTPTFSLPKTRILQSSFGDTAGAVGAAMLPMDRMS